MGWLDSAVRVWQRAPLTWRRWLVSSPLAPPLRRWLNRQLPDAPQVFELAEPLAGYRMRLHWQTHKAFVFGTHERHLVNVIQNVVQPGWLAVDLGAHIGYYTLLMAKQVGSSGKVIAFEPMPEIFSVLTENVQLNSCTNIVLENRAVVDHSGRFHIHRLDDDPLTSTSRVSAGGEGVEVEGISLDEYFAGSAERVAFVKIDIECAEDAALRGMSKLLRRDRPLIFLEAHKFDLWGDAHPALAPLREAGYELRFASPPGAQAHILASPR